MELSGRSVVVTGAGSGLGQATAELMVKCGARVAMLDTDPGGLRELTDRLGERTIGIPTDVTDSEAVASAVRRTLETFGSIHVCVNAAGVATPGPITDGRRPLALERFSNVVQVNLIGAFDVMRHCVTAMADNDPVDGERGVVVNVSSGAWHQGQRGQAAYAASKAGLVGLTLPVARDLARFGIRVVSIAPGLFDTAMAAGLSPAVREGLEQMILNPKRLGQPSEFAGLVRHVAENSYINATTIDLDAGVRMV